jgi:hypothetical protein
MHDRVRVCWIVSRPDNGVVDGAKQQPPGFDLLRLAPACSTADLR